MVTVNRFLATALDVAEAVRAERAARRFTQLQLANRAGVSPEFVADVEAGHPRAELGKVLQVLDALEIHALALPSVPTGRTLWDLGPDQETR
jgi:HTH-type transcriptional regulator/antitoxin HipB